MLRQYRNSFRLHSSRLSIWITVDSSAEIWEADRPLPSTEKLWSVYILAHEGFFTKCSPLEVVQGGHFSFRPNWLGLFWSVFGFLVPTETVFLMRSTKVGRYDPHTQSKIYLGPLSDYHRLSTALWMAHTWRSKISHTFMSAYVPPMQHRPRMGQGWLLCMAHLRSSLAHVSVFPRLPQDFSPIPCMGHEW